MDFSGVSRRRNRFLYEQIAAVIEEEIRSGRLAPDDPVPSEKYLMDATGTSRDAVRHAIASLRDRGLIYTVAHLGSYVSRDIPPG
jgi:DNA-binding GntR family transcriptional regulator